MQNKKARNKNDIGCRVIKKYQNRRLYDVATSTYIIFEDIKQMIIEGETISVVDVKTNEDVTRSVLLQIILEEEVNGVPMFSNEFMFQIIRFYGKAFQPSLSPFLEHGVDLFKRMQKNFYEQIKEVYGKEKLSSRVDLWQEFINNQGPQLENTIRDYIQNNTSVFLKMQENLREQAENILNYMPFPFNAKGK